VELYPIGAPAGVGESALHSDRDEMRVIGRNASGTLTFNGDGPTRLVSDRGLDVVPKIQRQPERVETGT
jgi:hypothetical protein